MRGENRLLRFVRTRSLGSSPHARGKLSDYLFLFNANGLIPACAGKTYVAKHLARAVWAHPRMRGENLQGDKNYIGGWGSSPHARGKPVSKPPACACFRLIPACAGKTGHHRAATQPAGAHPRMRGENNLCVTTIFIIGGSSPHARGKLVGVARPRHAVGLIPACAGKTLDMSGNIRGFRAHPRMRGENYAGFFVGFGPAGSSPHARGKR